MFLYFPNICLKNKILINFQIEEEAFDCFVNVLKTENKKKDDSTTTNLNDMSQKERDKEENELKDENIEKYELQPKSDDKPLGKILKLSRNLFFKLFC